MDDTPAATFNIDRDQLLETLGNMRSPAGSDLARYNRLLDLVYDSDGSLELDADMLDFYKRITKVAPVVETK